MKKMTLLAVAASLVLPTGAALAQESTFVEDVNKPNTEVALPAEAPTTTTGKEYVKENEVLKTKAEGTVPVFEEYKDEKGGLHVRVIGYVNATDAQGQPVVLKAGDGKIETGTKPVEEVKKEEAKKEEAKKEEAKKEEAKKETVKKETATKAGAKAKALPKTSAVK